MRLVPGMLVRDGMPPRCSQAANSNGIRPTTCPGNVPEAMASNRRRDVLAPAATVPSCLLLAVLRGAQALEDLLAGGTHRELLGVASRHPDLAAERHHRLSRHGAVHDLVLANVVREALVVPGLSFFLDLLALDHRS